MRDRETEPRAGAAQQRDRQRPQAHGPRRGGAEGEEEGAREDDERSADCGERDQVSDLSGTG